MPKSGHVTIIKIENWHTDGIVFFMMFDFIYYSCFTIVNMYLTNTFVCSIKLLTYLLKTGCDVGRIALVKTTGWNSHT